MKDQTIPTFSGIVFYGCSDFSGYFSGQEVYLAITILNAVWLRKLWKYDL